MGKPFAGQPGGGFGGFGQRPQGGGFGGFGQGQQGGGMGALQGFMRQMQPQGGGFGQRPQPQMAGAPPQNLGGFGQRPPPQMAGAPPQMQQPASNSGYDMGQLSQFSNVLRDLPQQPAGAPQQSQMSPQQMQSIMSAFAARQPQQAPQEMGVVDNRLGQNFGRPMVQQAPQFGGPQQAQMPGAPQQSQAMDAAFQDFIQQRQVGQQPAYGGFGSGIGINIAQPPQGAPQPLVSFPVGAMRFSDGGAVAEDPRMQAMRSIQQLANRQRGY